MATPRIVVDEAQHEAVDARVGVLARFPEGGVQHDDTLHVAVDEVQRTPWKTWELPKLMP